MSKTITIDNTTLVVNKITGWTVLDNYYNFMVFTQGGDITFYIPENEVNTTIVTLKQLLKSEK